MKKIFLFCACVALVGTMNAQLTSKKGMQILPESGDWSFSIKADPFINMASGLVTGLTSGSNNTAPTFDQYFDNQTLVFKRFTSSTTADRLLLNVGHTSNTSITQVDELDENGIAIADSYVNNSSRERSTHIGVGLGREYRRGHGRLQGYYGADAMVWLKGGSTTNNYGNDIARTQEASRDTKVREGLTIGLGVRGFLGAEYFFAPKMSVGAEFGYGLSVYSVGASKTKSETWNAADGAGETETNGTSRSLGASMDYDQDIDSNNPFSQVVGAGKSALKLSFYF